ncbi:MAG: translation initiation factor IF-6 [Candidatus Nanoarchaeia archaeon]
MHHNKHISILNFHGDPNIGLHGFATDRYCLVGRCVADKQVADLEKKLKVPVFRVCIYGTDLVGLFAAGNSSLLLLPHIIFENELETLKNLLEPLKVVIKVIKTEHTAFGNNILLNDKVAILSQVYNKKSVVALKAALGDLGVEQMSLANTAVPGSVGKITNKGGIFSPNLSDAEIKMLERLLKFEIGLGTVNLGNPFVASGLIANSFGFAIGSSSSGFEISRVDESLGFLR